MTLRLRGYSPALILSVIAIAAFGTFGPARADTSERQAAEAISHEVGVVYLGLGVLLPLVEDGKDGKSHTLRAAESTAISVAFSEILKQTIHERRPGGSSDRKSFPSGHTTGAFAIATAQSAFHPKQAPLWYAGAALVGWSRVRLDRHRWHDVAAGAALGYFTTRWELSRPHGLLLTPFIHPDSGATGLQVSKAF
jgi:membrane-associated phospholipid phosphatase